MTTAVSRMQCLRGDFSGNALFHKVMGTIDAPSKFEAKRLQLAQNVWQAMKKTDSRQCRNGHDHDHDSVDFTAQGCRAMNRHSVGLEEGQTCIDCDKGIAHRLPDLHEVDPTIVVGQR